MLKLVRFSPLRWNAIVLAPVSVLMFVALPSPTVRAADLIAPTETLDNGIVLPAEWPPRPKLWSRREPLEPPYLKNPPAVIPIDRGRQLFVDDFLIDSTTLTRKCHLPQYHSVPVMKPETPWEHHGKRPFAMAFSDGVWWDPEDGVFKMWYLAGPFTCLALSRDGLRWERPSLGVYSRRPKSNICKVPVIQRDSTTVWLDLEEKDPAARYKMSYFRTSLHILYSGDGVTWRSILAGDDGGGQRGLRTGDRSTLFYNPFRGRWVYSIRSGRRRAGGRCRYYIESDNLGGRPFRQGAERSRWACADALDLPYPGYGVDTQLYNLDAAPYESLMLGLFTIWHGDSRDATGPPKVAEDSRGGRPKINMVKVGFSRDGFHWSRPDRRAFLAVSERRGSWNWGNVQSVGGGCLVVGDRLYFYCSGRAGKGMPGCRDADAGGSTGVAFLRRDGFASMDAGAVGGTLTTRPLRFSGVHLFVNVKTPQGELRVEVLDEKGAPLAPLKREHCVPISTDKTLQLVGWRGAEDLSLIKGRVVRLRFHLRKGSLYSFWVSPDRTGASHGYVAAGGPGFTGARDTVGEAAYRAAAGLGK